MEDKAKCKCPTCGGTGEVDIVVSKAETNRPLAKKLLDKGYSVRAVAQMLGYKNPGSITNLLREPKKKIKK